MHIDSTRIWKTATPGYVVVLDAECRYDHQVHGRYLAAERCTPADIADLYPRDRRHDPRATPRWPCQQIVALSWLILTDGDDGLRPIRMETRGCPELDEAGIVAALFADMERLGRVQLISWGGFHADLPQILLAAAAAGLRLPTSLTALHSPWRRDASGHCDLMTEMCAGAKSAHLAEVAAKLNIPAKLTCRPNQVSRLMDQGKWSSIKAVAEGDVLTTTMLLMRWRHLLGGSVSTLDATRRLATFIAEHCARRPYAADWRRHGDDLLAAAFAAEARKVGTLGASACCWAAMIASVKGRKKQEINEMTIQHSIDIMQAWTHGLRIAMGYPEYAPIGNPVAFASGGRKNFAKALEIAAIVEQTGQDMVFVQFGLPIADGPIGVSLAVRANLHVNWHADVQLYLASDDSFVEILADTHRWSVGPRNVLTASALPPRHRIKRGVERAHRRWREVAERVHGVELIGSIFVPTGCSYADGVPMEMLSAAA